VKIHPTAIVEDGAELDSSVVVGPYSYIRSGAKIGAGTVIHSHVNIWGESIIGEENQIYPYTTIGAPPQIIGNEHPQARAVVGNKNIIRENVQIHRGSSKENNLTHVGNENYIMTSVHIAHDCWIGNKIVIASKTGLAGHVKIYDSAIVSGACGVSQFVRIGSFSFCAGMTRFEKDLPPFLCAKEFSEVTGPNLMGLKRQGYTSEQVRVVKEIYKTLYIEKGLYKDQIESLVQRFKGDEVFEIFYAFVKGSQRGIMR